jgi:hypothetical protein
MTGETTLAHCAIRMFRAVCVHLIRAVVLLGTNTGTIANLYVLDLGADLDDLANDFVTYTEREWNILAPAAGNGVDVGGADTAGINGDVDIVLFELLEWKLQDTLEAAVRTLYKPTSLRVNSLHFLMSVTANASVVSG